MNSLKILGLAAVAATAFMAFAGASSVWATALCTNPNETNACAPNSKYGEIEIHAVSTSEPKLWADPKGSTPLVTCKSSTMKGTIANTGSDTETVSGPLDTTTNAEGKHTGLTWTECSSTTDTVTTNASIGELEIHWISATDNGTVTSKNTDVTVNIAGISCTYGSGAGLKLGTLVGGDDPTLAINVTVNKVAGGFLCPEHTIWEANYTITTPHALYVTTL
jgi:hypothetical protein